MIFHYFNTEGSRHSCGGGTKGSSGTVEPRLSGELGYLKSKSHERVTSSLWRPPLYHPLPASAPVTQLISTSSVQLLPQRSWAPGLPVSGQALYPRPCPLSPLRKHLEDRVCPPSGAQHSARQADSRCSPLFFCLINEHLNPNVNASNGPACSLPPSQVPPTYCPGPSTWAEAAAVTPTGSAHTRWSRSSAVAQIEGSAGPGWR